MAYLLAYLSGPSLLAAQTNLDRQRSALETDLAISDQRPQPIRSHSDSRRRRDVRLRAAEPRGRARSENRTAAMDLSPPDTERRPRLLRAGESRPGDPGGHALPG